MKKILVLSFDDIKGANCAHCMLSFSKGEKYHCAALGNRKDCPLIDEQKDK